MNVYYKKYLMNNFYSILFLAAETIEADFTDFTPDAHPDATTSIGGQMLAYMLYIVKSLRARTFQASKRCR